MLTNDRDNGTGEDPLTGSFGRIIIVWSAAGGVAAVDGVTGGTIGGVCNRRIYPAVIQTGESAGLIDDACQGIGKAGVCHSIENHRAHRNLTGIRFSSGFGGNDSGQ